MKNTLVLSATAQVAALAPYPLTVRNISGTCTGANCWLQVFNIGGNITPATNDVPLYSIQVLGGPDGFNFPVSLECSKGLYIALSDTDRLYTAATGSTVTLQVEVEQVTVTGPTAIGSLTSTNRSTLQVCSEATGAATLRRLFDVFIVNASGANAWLMAFCTDSSSDGDEPVGAWPLGLVSTVVKVSFGPNGQVFTQSSGANVVKKGLTLRLSSTGNTLTGISSTNCRMLAYYTAT